MKPKTDNRVVLLCALCAFGLIVPGIAIISWIDVLDFDPCESVFRKAGAPCLSSGGTGIAVGTFIVFIGLAVIHGALKNGRKQYGDGPETLLFAWFGSWMAIAGAAVVYGGYSLWQV